MNDEFSGPGKKWKPGGNPPEMYDSSETPSPVSHARLKTGESKGLIRGEVSNFDSKPAAGVKDTNWLTWSFVLQLYDATSGERTKSYSVRMKFVSSGQLVNGHVVEVLGKFKNGVFVASRITDTITGATTYPAIEETTFSFGRNLLTVVALAVVILVGVGGIYFAIQWKDQKNELDGGGGGKNFPIPPVPPGPGDGTALTSNATYEALVAQDKAAYQEAFTACVKHTPVDFNAAQCERTAQLQEESRLRSAYAGHYGHLP